MIFFKWLDKISFLNIRIWDFSVNSLVRNYGIAFISRVIIRHPFKTIAGIRKYQQLNKNEELSDKIILVNPQYPEICINKNKSIIGAGFCLKPLKPECISGRANHDCKFFEYNLHLQKDKLPLCCKDCMIKKIGLMALNAKSNFYIMTSAKDILYDIIQPAVERGKYLKGLFCMCKYSFEPFKIALLISGIKGCLYSFETGDCKDYKTWHRADIGIKDEQTTLSNTFIRSAENSLSLNSSNRNIKFKKTGNIFYSYD
jgi:hypothetical protein